ncbi:hypothetical protein [Reinekea sp.]|jgi:hypothetical protein|uniref:hypothetical protein n=1 Tax=Reinekea sp. TaxID=1970455 RepID=UPI002A836DAF|nr:hypothetical protein [Reinekea sp.]
MIKRHVIQALGISLMMATLISCGPEANSRIGDEFWDPNNTKETFEPIELPDYSVTYRDETPDDSDDNAWTALLTVDLTALSRRSKEGIVPTYVRGLAEPKVIDDLIDTDVSGINDTQFFNNLEVGEDRRLQTDIAGDYRLVLDFDVVWPNGNSVSYVLDDIQFTVPGCQTNHLYYSDYINPVLADNCVNCHNAGDASSAFDLDATDLTVRRNSFLAKVDADGVSAPRTGTLLDYIYSADHSGASTVAAMTVSQSNVLTSFIARLKAIDDDSVDTRDVTADFTFSATDGADYCFARPSTMVVENG